MKVAIVGFGVEAQAALTYFKNLGYEITICDQNLELKIPEGIASQLGENYLDNLGNFDLICRSAGVHPKLILDKNPGIEAKVTSVINEFFKASPTKNIIGVTGTKGKGTTSTLISLMLEKAGQNVKLGGNIGLVPLAFLNELKADSWVVLELSSFQLIDLRVGPHVAVCLIVAPEHLNWHQDMVEYIEAKGQIFKRQSEQDFAVYYAAGEIPKQIAFYSPGTKIPYFEKPGAYIENDDIMIDDELICKTSEVKLRGAHNLQNICAAVTAVWQVSKDQKAVHSVLTSFIGLEHRLQFVKKINDVSYFDDSFGTTPETAIVAVEAFKEPKVLILGGSDKGAKYDELARVIARSNVKSVIAIGNQASAISESLKSAGFENIVSGGNSMSEIVNQAARVAQAGDVVLLSPACASFDMFENYKDRAAQFIQAVNEL